MRRFIWPALAALLLAGALAWLTRPSTTAPQRPKPRRPPPTRVLAPEPVVPATSTMSSTRRDVRPTEPAPPRRPPARTETPQPTSTEGVATSILARRDDIEECLLDEEDAGRPFRGRPTLRVTVFPEGDIGRAEVVLADTDQHRADAEACLGELFRDAVFELPETEHTVVWPIPWR